MKSVSQKVIQSSSFLLLIQVVQRGLGIISTLILARLLAPEQFGIIALVAISLQLFDILADTGNQHYIIQKDNVSDQDLNTAWSLDLGIKSLMMLLIIASAPFISAYFNAPQLCLALWVSSLVLPIKAVRNPILMLQAKQLNYKPVFKLHLWQKVASFCFVISIALIWQTFWAIVIGNLIATLVFTLGSYRISSYRPQLDFRNINEQWRFSKWLILRGIVGFTRSQIDSILVSRWFGTRELGGFHLLRELAIMPALNLVIPASEPLQAAIAHDRHQQQTLAYRTRFSLALLSSLLLPISCFMWLYPVSIVSVLLGEQWLSYAPLLQPFSLYFFTFCLFSLCCNACLAVGQARLLFWFDLVSTAIIVTSLLYFQSAILLELTWLRAWLAILTTVSLMAILERKTTFNWIKLLLMLLPACFGLLLSVLMVELIAPLINLPVLVEIILNGLIFCCAFVIGFVFICRITSLISMEIHIFQTHLQRLMPARLHFIFTKV
ncbi:polysaccharide biosynthesis protein [Alishewanella agri BL06]|uniref:Polysaccharide biosynthesis protein n=1 Tax=Alishewanella agri BL06 TaxID=1195246 RepID=I9DW12_9ALTE|nr:oligosaccharide flippase family protein [Alishewanella agri]EIW90365.1 polysaccharide biosynthesis protein [Alishewanella agri BL06]